MICVTGNIFHQILNPAIQNSSQVIEGRGGHGLVLPELIGGGAVKMVVLDQGVGRFLRVLQRFSKGMITNQWPPQCNNTIPQSPVCALVTAPFTQGSPCRVPHRCAHRSRKRSMTPAIFNCREAAQSLSIFNCQLSISKEACHAHLQAGKETGAAAV